MSEANKAVVRRLYEEVASEGKYEILNDIIASNYVGHDNANPDGVKGPDGVKQNISQYRNAFPDMKMTVDDLLCEGDKVTIRWTAQGTNTGELNGMPPTGKHVTVTGLSVERVADGKIQENWGVFDMMGMMQQLGVIPSSEG